MSCQGGRTRKSRRSRGQRTYLPRPTRGALKPYSTSQGDATRHRILEKKIDELGYTSVIRDLNLRSTMNKGTAPAVSRKMKKDMEWMRRQRKSRGRKSKH